MSAEKKYIERDMIIAQHWAVDAAVSWVFAEARRLGGIEHVNARDLGPVLFPLPKVERPRLRACKSHEFKVVDGRMFSRRFDTGDWGLRNIWVEADGFRPERGLVAIWHDLFTTPNELVDDSGEET